MRHSIVRVVRTAGVRVAKQGIWINERYFSAGRPAREEEKEAGENFLHDIDVVCWQDCSHMPGAMKKNVTIAIGVQLPKKTHHEHVFGAAEGGGRGAITLED